MRGYIKYFGIRIKAELQYRVAAWAGIATQFFWGMMLIMIYEAFYENGSGNEGITFVQLVTYVWLQQSFLKLVTIWSVDGEIVNLIRTGNVSYELARPYNLYNLWFVKVAAGKLASVALRFLPILIIGFIMPKPYNLTLPCNFTSFVLFLVTLALGLFITVSFSMFIYIFTFKYTDSKGPVSIIVSLYDVLSGSIIPIPLMPLAFQKMLYFLPFRLTSDLPFRIYSGNIMLDEAVFSIVLQIIWSVLLIWAGEIMMRRISKHIVVQGG